MNKLFRNPKTRVRNMIIIIVPFIILACIFGFIAFKSASSLIGNVSGTNTTSSNKNSIESMGYYLRSDATDYQNKLFLDLKNSIEDGTDKSLIADLVVKNYIADFYTWTNKNGPYDVGGMYYIYGPSKANVYIQARNEFYKYLTYYIKTYGKENLLEVISIDNEEPQESTYTYNGKTYTSYFVVSRWEYAERSSFFAKSFITKEYFTVIENEGRFEIVQAYGDEQ